MHTYFFSQKKIQGGDIREFERLFAHYFEPLCLHAFTMLKDMDAAEDIVQEFFYRFWKNREAIGIKLSLNAYLFKSIRNRCLHYLEHETVKKEYESQSESSRESSMNASHTELELKELKRAVEETLERLPERCSLVFKMNRFEGKKYREIAETLSISIKTVEADMGKALAEFRKTLGTFLA